MKKKQSRNGMLILNDEHFISYDGRNYTLFQRRTAESGKQYESPIGYYGSILNAMFGYIDHLNRLEARTDTIDTFIDNYTVVIEKARRELSEAVKGVVLEASRDSEEEDDEIEDQEG